MDRRNSNLRFAAGRKTGEIRGIYEGYYHITVRTRRPESGYWGDDQIICLYFNKLEEMPKLSWTGVPYLFTEGQEAETHEGEAQETDIQGPNSAG